MPLIMHYFSWRLSSRAVISLLFAAAACSFLRRHIFVCFARFLFLPPAFCPSFSIASDFIHDILLILPPLITPLLLLLSPRFRFAISIFCYVFMIDFAMPPCHCRHAARAEPPRYCYAHCRVEAATPRPCHVFYASSHVITIALYRRSPLYFFIDAFS